MIAQKRKAAAAAQAQAQQQQQAANTADMVAKGAGAAKDASQAELGKNSALDQLMAGIKGQ